MEKNKYFTAAQTPENLSQTIDNMNIQYGWVCPKCDRVYAPTVIMCLHCGRDNFSICTSDMNYINLRGEKD